MPIRLTLPKPKKEWRFLVPEKEVRKFAAKGFAVSPHRRRGKYLVTKKKPRWQRFEDEVLILFRDGLKLSAVDGGPVFRIAGNQIDVVGGIEDTLLVVECKSKLELGKKSLRSAIRSFWVKRREVSNSIRRSYASGFNRTKFILALQGITPSDRDLKFAKKKKIIVWSESYLESIRSLYFTIGERAKYYILKELGGKPPLVPGGKGRYFAFPAMAANSGDGQICTLLMPAFILLDIAYVLRIESGQKKAYQRFLDKARLSKIAKFLEDGKTFKNSIVLSLDTRAKFSARKLRWRGVPSYGCRTGLLKIPRQYASAWVIDGQHRLYGFARSKSSLQNTLLPVVALRSQSRSQEAETFIDINKNQKPVDPNLLWALFGQLYRNETKGVISDLVRRLATEKRSELFNQIYVPGESKHPRRNYRIFHSNLCESIADHLVAQRPNGFPLIGSENLYEPKRSQVLKNCIAVMNLYLSFLFEAAENAKAKVWVYDFFLTNNGLNVMIRFLVQVLKYFDGKIDRKKLREDFGRPLAGYLDSHKDKIDDLRRSTSSEGTREAVAYELIRTVAKDVKGFAGKYLHEHQEKRMDSEPHKQLREIEESLRMCISESLTELSKNWWKERIPPDAKESAEERKAKDEAPWPWMEGKQYPAHYYLDFSDYSRIIKRRDNWREAFQRIFKTEEWIDYWFKEIERIRIEIAHHRDLTEREFTVLQLFSDDFSRVLAGAKSSLELPTLRDVEAPVPVEP
jgi:DNA sulfur modification protein DndB